MACEGVEHRIADKRVLRLIQKWLKAGVVEDGVLVDAQEGTPQGASASTLLGERVPSLRVRPVGRSSGGVGTPAATCSSCATPTTVCRER